MLMTIGYRDHLCSLVMLGCSDELVDSSGVGSAVQLVDRCVVGVLRVAARHMVTPECIDMLLHAIYAVVGCCDLADGALVCRSVAYGVHELVRANAANIHASAHWRLLCAILAAAAARHPLPPSVREECLQRLRVHVEQHADETTPSPPPPPPVQSEVENGKLPRAQSVVSIVIDKCFMISQEDLRSPRLSRMYTSEPQLNMSKEEMGERRPSQDSDWIHVQQDAAAVSLAMTGVCFLIVWRTHNFFYSHQAGASTINRQHHRC
jgi:hypothetical protein